MNEQIFKAGEYYIGDPCYSLDRDSQDERVEFVEKSFGSGYFEHNGFKVFVHSTAWGDGVYQDNFGNEYPVDSGYIGLLPIEVCGSIDSDLGKTFSITEDFQVGYVDGVFNIGPVEINTNDDDEDIDEDYP